jgi:hypothetical protein
MGALTAVGTFLKDHWSALLLVLVLAGGYAWIRKEEASFATTIAGLNASHQAEIDKMNADKVLEEQQHAQEKQQLQASLDAIQATYAAARAQLQVQQTQEQNQIVAKYGNDADGLAALVASKYGFVVIKPATP